MKYDLSLNPIQASDLSTFEALIGSELPSDYKSFLLAYNGGRPERPVLESQGSKIAVNDLYGLGEQEGRVGGLEEAWDMFSDRIPRRFIPIGDTAGGDQFLLSVGEGGLGVFLFDHENEPEDAGDNVEDYPNIRKLAGSFSEFIETLKPYE
ncbi:SMI1/KNR4 family protein [Xanthomonas cerealis]|uniref:SMI1/KNR4 family protein n=1 Tax=Xanthomonas cerealis TaxID=3390025 RepID=UPI000578E592|nr:SMI1/KNR4 family protein [Xanthomonas translucens]UKE46264.1 SMI1/KNR4 family protein [Xanthomonas translucens pv. cerealis]